MCILGCFRISISAVVLVVLVCSFLSAVYSLFCAVIRVICGVDIKSQAARFILTVQLLRTDSGHTIKVAAWSSSD